MKPRPRRSPYSRRVAHVQVGSCDLAENLGRYRIYSRIRDPRDVIGLFRHKPATWFYGCRHSVKGNVSLRQVKKQSACVNEIELAFLEGITDHVVLPHVEIRQIESVQEPRIDISRDHATIWPDLAAQPLDNRATTGSDLQAPPTIRDTQCAQETLSAGVEEALVRCEALSCMNPGVV
jgi:hypothetical protein